jgi:hypothetical protein
MAPWGMIYLRSFMVQALKWYYHVYSGMRDENNGFYFGWLDLLAPWLQVLLITLKYSSIADLHDFLFTVAHALGLSVFNSRLLATDLNTETRNSTHYEVFLLLLVQSLLNLGTHSSSLRLTRKSCYIERGIDHTEITALLEEPLRNIATGHREPRSYCC